ncbi:MAG TPA: hypothetical protein VF188_03315 [Longimicrobiales bacterium]
MRLWVVTVLLAGWLGLGGCGAAGGGAEGGGRQAGGWWKGNLHTHSLWSDGDGYPEMIADWYRRHGYHFLVISDHNVPPQGGKWIDVARSEGGPEAFRRYEARFGDAWVEERRRGDTLEVRLRRHEEYAPLLAEPGRFLLLPGEEITEYLGKTAIHMVATNLAEPIVPRGGESVAAVLRNDLGAVIAQRERTGRPMIVQVNHPNFIWSLTAEDLIPIEEARFFEVYNGHPLVNNVGDDEHPGTERLWDVILTERLRHGGPVLYGVATDDAHDYHAFAPDQRNPGRGWIMVRAPELTPAALIAAMERGDFYATTGVVLRDIRRDGDRLTIEIEAEDGVDYVTRFIGTRVGSGAPDDPGRRPAAGAVPVRRAAAESAFAADGTTAAGETGAAGDVGVVLAEVAGTTASYRLRGDELYVRAKVISTKPRTNAFLEGQVEVAWVQPQRGTGAPRP